MSLVKSKRAQRRQRKLFQQIVRLTRSKGECINPEFYNYNPPKNMKQVENNWHQYNNYRKDYTNKDQQYLSYGNNQYQYQQNMGAIQNQQGPGRMKVGEKTEYKFPTNGKLYKVTVMDAKEDTFNFCHYSGFDVTSDGWFPLDDPYFVNAPGYAMIGTQLTRQWGDGLTPYPIEIQKQQVKFMYKLRYDGYKPVHDFWADEDNQNIKRLTELFKPKIQVNDVAKYKFGKKIFKCKCMDYKNSTFVLIHYNGFAPEWTYYYPLDDPYFLNMPNNVQVGSNLQRTWGQRTYTVGVKDVFKGVCYKFHYDNGSKYDDFWCKAENTNLQHQQQRSQQQAEKEMRNLRQTQIIERKQQGIGQSVAYSAFNLLFQQQQGKGKYDDATFPAVTKSITGDKTNKKAKKYRNKPALWKRPEEFYGNKYDVFEGGIEPNDIKQGDLGDCYFLVTLSSMAEWPHRLKRIFVTTQKNNIGAYCVKLCDMGVWKDVIVDDKFPCQSKPCFTKGNGSELWVLILEKVWAKIYGDYVQIESGWCRECLHDLTGAPTFNYVPASDADKIWTNMLAAEKNDYIMTSTTSNCGFKTDKANEKTGIVSFHAYSLLSCHQIKKNGRQVRLVKLRNPWGYKEWTGDWSDSSPLWTNALRQQVGQYVKNDGIFCMEFGTWAKYFTSFQICKYEENNEYVVVKSECAPMDPVYFTFSCKTKGRHNLTVNQESKRKFPKGKYQYSKVKMTLSQINPAGGYWWVGDKCGAEKELVLPCDLVPGSYVVRVQVNWYQDNVRPFTLSDYFPKNSGVSFQYFDERKIGEFEDGVLMNHANFHGKKQDLWGKYKPNGTFKCTQMFVDGMCYFYYNNLKGNKTYKERVKFSKFKGMVWLRYPHKGDEFTVVIPPGQERIVVLGCTDDYSIKYNYWQSSY